MGKHISSFATTASFEDMRPMLKSPHVSLTKDNMQVHCKSLYIETKITGKMNAVSAADREKTICGETSGISAIEIDGVTLQTVPETYTFSTEGEHTIVYTLADPTTIEEDTFFGTDLESITIPDSVTSISDAFRNCSRLRKIIVLGDNPVYDSRNNCNAIIETATNELIVGCSRTSVFPSVTSIGDGAFYGSGLGGSIFIPKSVTRIGNSAFQDCIYLTSVTIGDGVTNIGDDAFYGCTGLQTVSLGKSITSIGNNAFQNCTSLSQLYFRNSLTDIGNYAFSGCESLALDLNLSTYNNIVNIGNYAFYGCAQITRLLIPDDSSITNIGDSAFENCSALVNITVSSYCSISHIGKNAFDGTAWFSGKSDGLVYLDNASSIIYKYKGSMPDFTTINIGSRCADSAFEGCTGLRTVMIHPNVSSIGNSVFRGCTGLKTVNFMGHRIGSIGDYAFDHCTSLTTVTIPDNPFDVATSIGDYAFNYCTGLTSVTIPRNVTSIGDYAFSGCTSLETINSGIMEPFEINNNVFSSSTYTNAELHVPAGTASLYQSTQGWSSFVTSI